MFTVNPWLCYYAAVLVLLIPIKWLLAAFFAAAFHELCHTAAILLLGEEIHRIHLHPFGVRMEVSFSDTWKELLAALAGPAGSFFLLTLCHVWPTLSLCAFVQGIFNLLPVYPMDGGRILKCLMQLIFPGLWKNSLQRQGKRCTIVLPWIKR